MTQQYGPYGRSHPIPRHLDMAADRSIPGNAHGRLLGSDEGLRAHSQRPVVSPGSFTQVGGGKP
jgi:hypothetical protein